MSIGNLSLEQNEGYIQAFFGFLSENLGVPPQRGYMSVTKRRSYYMILIVSFYPQFLVRSRCCERRVSMTSAWRTYIIFSFPTPLQQLEFRHSSSARTDWRTAVSTSCAATSEGGRWNYFYVLASGISVKRVSTVLSTTVRNTF